MRDNRGCRGQGEARLTLPHQLFHIRFAVVSFLELHMLDQLARDCEMALRV